MPGKHEVSMNDNRKHGPVFWLGVVLLAVFVFLTQPPGQGSYTSLVCIAKAAQEVEDPWRQEFNDVCSMTTYSMSLSQEELKSLIDRCEKLEPVIEGLEETTRKVYRKRLKGCLKLFVFVLETKK
jgi:hypothetical protein